MKISIEVCFSFKSQSCHKRLSGLASLRDRIWVIIVFQNQPYHQDLE